MRDHEGDLGEVTRDGAQIDRVGVAQVAFGIHGHAVGHDHRRAKFGGHLAFQQFGSARVTRVDVRQRMHVPVGRRDEIACPLVIRDHGDHERLDDIGGGKTLNVPARGLGRRHVRQQVVAAAEAAIVKRLAETGAGDRIAVDVLLEQAHGEQVDVRIDRLARPGRRSWR